MKVVTLLFSFFVVGLLVATAVGKSNFIDDDEKETKVPAALDFKMKSIDGKEINLSDYQGDVVLVVNTASKCGLTPQYKGLQALHDKYSGIGLRVLGFPCNQFGGQEPGSEKEIKGFCQKNYGVSFEMFSKIDVNGDGQAALYEYLTAQKTQPAEAGKISWNFEKFIIDREGKVIARFGPRTSPDDENFVGTIEKALGSSKKEGAGKKVESESDDSDG